MRNWMGVGLLSASWLFGLGLYRPQSWFFWAASIVLAVLLFRPATVGLPSAPRRWAAFVLLLPAVWFFPMPSKAAPLLLAVGLGLTLASIPRGWALRLGRAAVAAGAVLSAQAAAVFVYADFTARSHDLPWPISELLSAAVRMTGAEVSADGVSLAVYAAGNTHRLAATWDLFVDPATLCFWAGALVVLAMLAWNHESEKRPHRPFGTWLRSAAVLTAVVLAWLPLRAAILVSLYISRVSRAEPGLPLTTMDQFLSPWPSLLLLIGLIFLVTRLVFIKDPPRPLQKDLQNGLQKVADPQPAAEYGRRPWRYAVALLMAAVSIAVLWAVWTWEPVGRRKDGRVMVVEKHSLWEPTDAAYDKKSYGEPASYTYSLIYDYCSHFMQMSRLMETDKIDAQKLNECDVLILKTPTARFSRQEVNAVRRFVKRGGGLLLIGDHTNVFNCSTFLNDVGREFGFTFNNDLLFCVGSPYQQAYRPALVPHPSVGYIDKMDFAVSCSINPGTSSGRAAIQSGGLWALPPEYSYPNFHPPARYQPEMRFGSFVQLWTTHYGRGRVAAFSDSTIFSNFCIFQPGKTELFLGMIEWLNHTSAFDKTSARLAVTVPFGLLALGVFIASARLVRCEQGGWLGILAAAICGLTLSSVAVAAASRIAMPWPSPTTDPPREIVVDREVSTVPLSKGAFGQGTGERFGLLEQWIPRVGFFTKRCDDDEITSGDGLVVICPGESVDAAYRRRLVEYVKNGGRLLVFDSPSNGRSTANSLLWPFGLSMQHASQALGGKLALPDGKVWPSVEIEMAKAVVGGEPIATIDGTSVAAQVKFGQGTVTAVGFASAFNDQHMGGHWMQPPDAELLDRYKLLYALFEMAFQGKKMAVAAKE